MADGSNITATLVLVHPPQEGLLEGFASGLVALANYVSRRLPRVRVQLLDLGLIADSRLELELRDVLVSINGPLFVGITTTTASYQAALRVARTFKRLCRECVVILGGHHASAQDDVILKAQDSIDYVVRGEGEIALVQLLEQYPDVGRVPNLSHRDNLTICRNAPAPFLGERELDELAPAFKGWGLRSAPGKFEHTTYVSARGCPLRCAFCSVANEQIRAKSVAAVVRELRVLIEDFGYRSIAVEDNFFAHAPRRTLALCAAIETLQRELPFSTTALTPLNAPRSRV